VPAADRDGQREVADGGRADAGLVKVPPDARVDARVLGTVEQLQHVLARQAADGTPARVTVAGLTKDAATGSGRPDS
jgi:hypothetical protein